ncbi:MAG: cbb3-type cytochrome c oxidase subunit I, partial [Pseudomonadota bacterium]
MSSNTDATRYSEDVVKKFVLAAIFWGVVGFLAGDFIAWQLAFPALNLDLEWTSFGRLRPVHTSAVIFAFGGNILFSTSLYVVTRTCRTDLFGGRGLGNFIFWNFQALI